jgi:hypothetical protein
MMIMMMMMMIMMVIIKGHECIWDQPEEGGRKARILRGEEDGSTLHISINTAYETHKTLFERGEKKVR